MFKFQQKKKKNLAVKKNIIMSVVSYEDKFVQSSMKMKTFTTPIQISEYEFIIIQQQKTGISTRICNSPIFNLCIFNINNNKWTNKKLNWKSKTTDGSFESNEILLDDLGANTVAYEPKSRELFVLCSLNTLISINLSSFKFTDFSTLLKSKLKNNETIDSPFLLKKNFNGSKIFIWSRDFLDRFIFDVNTKKIEKIKFDHLNDVTLHNNSEIKCIVNINQHCIIIATVSNELDTSSFGWINHRQIKTTMQFYQYLIQDAKLQTINFTRNINVSEEFALQLQTAKFIAVGHGRYLIICPIHDQFIHVYDVKNKIIMKSNIKIFTTRLQIHAFEEISIICMQHDDADKKLVFNYVNHCYKIDDKFKKLTKLPVYLIQIICKFYINETLHILKSDGSGNNSHLKLNVDEILSEIII